MKENTFTLKLHSVREYPDPVKGIKHYVLLCRANSIPEGILLDANPRDQNTNKAVAKEVRESLDSADGRFHLKNKGITMLAESVRLDGQKFRAEVVLRKGQGIVDGGHTYKVIRESSDAEEISDKQFVKIEILTNVSEDYISEIAGGLNTSMQVADMSLENLKQHFNWIKDELKGEPYEKQIFYRENANAPGDISIRDIVALLTMFIPDKMGYPKDANPKLGYGQKAKCLKEFQGNLEGYEAMRPILKDILQLHDYILYHAVAMHNAHKQGGNAAAFTFMHGPKKRGGLHWLYYMHTDIEYLMQDGALYPILGAFRYLVEKRDGKIGWKLGAFNEVKEFCDSILGQMMVSTQNISVARGRDVNAVGKDDTHWENLYKTVALEFLTRKNESR